MSAALLTLLMAQARNGADPAAALPLPRLPPPQAQPQAQPHAAQSHATEATAWAPPLTERPEQVPGFRELEEREKDEERERLPLRGTGQETEQAAAQERFAVPEQDPDRGPEQVLAQAQAQAKPPPQALPPKKKAAKSKASFESRTKASTRAKARASARAKTNSKATTTAQARPLGKRPVAHEPRRSRPQPPLPAPAIAPSARPRQRPTSGLIHELTVRVDPAQPGRLLPVLRRGERWFIRREHLQRLALRPPPGWASVPPLVALDRKQGFEAVYDAATQRLDLSVPAGWLGQGGDLRPAERNDLRVGGIASPVDPAVAAQSAGSVEAVPALASSPPRPEVAAAAAVTMPPRVERAPSEGLVHALTIRVNRADAGWVLPVLRRGGRWHMSRENLQQLPLRPPSGWEALPPMVALDHEHGFETEYDAAEQRLELTAPVSWLGHRYTWIGGGPAEPVEAPTTGPAGLVLNYDLAASQSLGGDGPAGRASRLALATEWRWFSTGTGTLTHTQLSQFRRVGDLGGGEGGWHGNSVRLDTRWQETRPGRLLRWELGDAVTDPGTGMHALRFGGLKIGTDFDLQPYLVTSALPTWFGSTALPSTVDLYVDGLRRYHGEAEPGTIALDAIPGISGSGQATIVVTDALGRRRTIEFPFYATSRLLREGLTGWSFSMGHARLGYGLESNRYDERLLATGRIRHGLTRQLTAGAAFEATEGVRTIGFLGAWAPGNAGVLTPSLSVSDATDPLTGSALGGSRLGLGYEWGNRRFSFNAEAARTTAGYRDVASLYGAHWPRSLTRLSLGWGLGMNGSMGLSWLRQIDAQGQDGRYLSANWYRSFGPDWGISLALTRSRTEFSETAGWLGITRTLGPRLTTTVQQTMGSGRDGTTVAVSQMMTADQRDAWRVQATTVGEKPAVMADYTTETPLARAQAQVQARGENLSAWLGAQGAVAWMSGHRLASRSIPDAFGLVSTDGVPGVTVRVENRRVGETNSDGLLLAPLYGWLNNRVSVDALELPADLQIEAPQRQIVGRGHAGSLVRFSMRRSRAATISLVDEAGLPLPLGSSVDLVTAVSLLTAANAAGAAGATDSVGSAGSDDRTGTGASDSVTAIANTQLMIGYDGEVWLDGLAPLGNRVEVQVSREQRCSARFDLPAVATGPARLGPITCWLLTPTR